MRFHGQQAAVEALADFEARFQKNAIPDDIPEVRGAVGAEGLPVLKVIKEAGLTSTTSDASRMIDQGAVKLDGERIEDRAIVLKAGRTVVLQVGKRKFAKVVLA